MFFEVAGIHVSPIVPVVSGFLIALITTPAGISGAFLLLPLQVSLLGFATPAVTPTNLLFNVASTPGGVYGYARRREMNWSLARSVLMGTVPGVLLGVVVRVRAITDSDDFRLFAGAVLLLFAGRLLLDLCRMGRERPRPRIGGGLVVTVSAVVGLVGGIYGIGGGAFIAPFLVSIMGFTVVEVAGVALLSTLVTSVVGMGAFYALGIAPDIALGALFGLGGLAGSYLGARLQKRLQDGALRLLLSGLLGAVGLTYVTQGLRSRS